MVVASPANSLVYYRTCETYAVKSVNCCVCIFFFLDLVLCTMLFTHSFSLSLSVLFLIYAYLSSSHRIRDRYRKLYSKTEDRIFNGFLCSFFFFVPFKRIYRINAAYTRGGGGELRDDADDAYMNIIL